MRGFQTPPECQGQIVVVSYMCAGEHIVQRVFDQSDRSESYYIADIEDDDWEWYETYEAVNGSPPIPEDRWEKIEEDDRRLARILSNF